MNNAEVGDFIITNFSNYPSLIISKDFNNINDYLLITIHEYNGDYKIIETNEIIEIINLSVEEKLCILSRYGDWFYDEHKNIFQELIIECINI